MATIFAQTMINKVSLHHQKAPRLMRTMKRLTQLPLVLEEALIVKANKVVKKH